MNTGSFLCLVCLTSLTRAYPNGMPDSACKDMMPKHGVPAQTSEPPFTIEVVQGVLDHDYAEIHYRLKSLTNMSFKGFVIYVEQSGKQMPHMFDAKPGLIKQACPVVTEKKIAHGNYAATHVSNDPKTSVQGVLYGQGLGVLKPTEPVFLKAVVVQDKLTFWKDLKVEIPRTSQYTQRKRSNYHSIKQLNIDALTYEQKKAFEELKAKTMKLEKEMRERWLKEDKKMYEEITDLLRRMDRGAEEEEVEKPKSKGGANPLVTISVTLLLMSVFSSILFQI